MKMWPKLTVCGSHQVEPVHFGARKGPLVGQNHALVEPGKCQRSDQSLAGSRATVGQGEGLVEDVEGGCLLPHQDTLLQPGLVVVPCPGVDVVRFPVPGLLFPLDDTHDVVGAQVVVLVLKAVPHAVVGLADDGGEVGYLLWIVACASERFNNRHTYISCRLSIGRNSKM